MTRFAILAILLLHIGSLRAQRPADCWILKKHGQQQQARTCFQQLLRSTDAAVRAEGYWGLEDWDRSNEQFRVATRTPGNVAQAKARWGMLLHERFNDKEAADLFREALTADPSNADAYIGLATISAETFDGDAMWYINKLFSIDPDNVRAHELAASLALDNDQRDQAADEAKRALSLDPQAVDAMAVYAAIEVIDERSPEPWLNRITAVNPHDGLAYSQIAHYLELHYRHEDAAHYYRRAVVAEPELWSAHSALGISLMRLGQQDEAQKELELSYNHGYRDAATVNSLRLLDSYRNYVTIRDANSILKLRTSESDLLSPYLQDELLAIVTTYNKKYAMTLPRPVQLEVYPNHEDFAVRTMGMPGLGALGVTFGDVIAIDSPSARRPGDFNWGATLWHEMSHVYVLTATRNHVPRWFTEGLAVHEEGEHSAEWRNRATPDVLIAIRDKKLLPVTQLDSGFVHPQYPGQVVVSYFQAGTMCDFIKEKWGEAKLLEMIHSYAALRTTPEIVQRVFATSPSEFDQQYFSWIDKHYGSEASHLEEWRQQMKALALAAQSKQWQAVVRQGPAVVLLYPDYIGPGNAYEILADAYQALKDPRSEASSLTAYEHAGGEDPVLLKRLAQLQQSLGNNIAAAGTLARINYIYPVNDPELHHKLGDLLYEQKRLDSAIREYRALLASHPVDQAGAEYLLAKAYLAAGNSHEAETRVLAALEIAPGYVPAQKLLLELHASSER